jgi:hypothetical protein
MNRSLEDIKQAIRNEKTSADTDCLWVYGDLDQTVRLSRKRSLEIVNKWGAGLVYDTIFDGSEFAYRDVPPQLQWAIETSAAFQGQQADYRERIEWLVADLPHEGGRDNERELGGGWTRSWLGIAAELYESQAHETGFLIQDDEEAGELALHGQNGNLDKVMIWFGMKPRPVAELGDDHPLVKDKQYLPGNYYLTELWPQMSVEHFGQLLLDNPNSRLWHVHGPFCEKDTCPWHRNMILKTKILVPTKSTSKASEG